MRIPSAPFPWPRPPIDPPAEYQWLRENAPVTRVEIFGGEYAWLVTRYDDVRSILRWHLEYLRDRGVPVRGDQLEGGPVVVEDDEGIAWVLGKADEVGLEVTDAEVAIVLQTELAYFEAIGAIGGEVPEPPDEVI